MCEPTIIIGAATAVMGGLQSVASYQQQQAQYQYQEQVANFQYQQQMQAYQASQRAYAEQIRANTDAANRAYQQEQLKLKGEYDKAAQNAQQLLVAKLKSQGEVFSSGRTGRSVQLLATDAERAYGRDLANLGTNLGYAQDAYFFNALGVEAEAKSANAVAAAQRMTQPVRLPSGPPPSAAGMVLGLGSAALGGYQAYTSLKAPTGFTTPSSPSSFPSSTNVNFGQAMKMPNLLTGK